LRDFFRHLGGLTLEELNAAPPLRVDVDINVDEFLGASDWEAMAIDNWDPEWEELGRHLLAKLKLNTKPPKARTTPQKIHHYTRLQQIDALSKIGEDPSPDIGYMTRMLTLCSLPRTDPGNQLQYARKNGPNTLVMIAGGRNKLPFGNLPRLLLAWVCTEVVHTKSRDLVLGPSLAMFMQDLGELSNNGGKRGERTRLKTQIDRLFNSHVQLIYEDKHGKSTVSSMVADETNLTWVYTVA
jgi:hypothetical protein